MRARFLPTMLVALLGGVHEAAGATEPFALVGMGSRTDLGGGVWESTLALWDPFDASLGQLTEARYSVIYNAAILFEVPEPGSYHLKAMARIELLDEQGDTVAVASGEFNSAESSRFTYETAGPKSIGDSKTFLLQATDLAAFQRPIHFRARLSVELIQLEGLPVEILEYRFNPAFTEEARGTYLYVPVPEPGAAALAATGLAILGALRRRTAS